MDGAWDQWGQLGVCKDAAAQGHLHAFVHRQAHTWASTCPHPGHVQTSPVRTCPATPSDLETPRTELPPGAGRTSQHRLPKEGSCGQSGSRQAGYWLVDKGF